MHRHEKLTEMTKSEAINRGYESCVKCYGYQLSGLVKNTGWI